MNAPTDATEVFGRNVFSERVMRERLPRETFTALTTTIERGAPLTAEVADVVANAMKDWAIERGATHYTHWFQPLTGGTAEKHDAFISPREDGSIIMEFSGKQLTRGEPDAPSFPSGGLRSTFEARGYTAWDCTSHAFLKKDAAGNVTLCIPTAFCSYTGLALDTKTPLLRSMGAVSKQATRVLHALGHTTTTRVVSTVGPEQEYFLVDKQFYSQRLDLMVTGRTLFGAPPPKGQELEDQYFGAIKDRVSTFMRDLDVELWLMGITSKTKHNEVAPAQYENAPIFATANIAADHNQLIMETMQKVALRHNLVCLLHEKPYAGVNGSGKHNNWSLSTDDGINLLDPGTTPHDNEQFLIFLCALIQSIDKHADILRASAASAGNDLRLGGNEAPPAVVSIFLGEELTQVLMSIAKGEAVAAKNRDVLQIGVDTLPPLPKDNTDRNRTSPFAFTGDKFEFRMVGSSASISDANTVLNTIVAEALDEFATRLERADNINAEAAAIVRDVVERHGRVLFNGNSYAEEWLEEAAGRGLPNIQSTVAALNSVVTPKAVDLFGTRGVLSEQELRSRHEIQLERYAKQINVEAVSAIEMAHKQYVPAIIEYAAKLGQAVQQTAGAGVSTTVQKELLTRVNDLLHSAYSRLQILESELAKAQTVADVRKQAETYRDDVVPAMSDLREDIDRLEMLLPKDRWPVPSYTDMMFKL
ncbi:MAG: glutamine synthetase III [Candidatus Pacebacteria bacterium]|nr:glutamine synthetase III [Candidatus Paceibacterota bacterium]